MFKRFLKPSLRITVLASIIIFQPSLRISVHNQSPGEALLYQEDFESGEAPGWQLEPGWEVRQEGEGHLLSGVGHAWARSETSLAGDYRLRFRLQLLRERIHLVYRMNDTGRYYIGFHSNGSELNKQYWPDTFLDRLAASQQAHPLGEWLQVEIIGEGPWLRFLVNGELEWEYSDPDALLFGTFAFETLDNSAAYIDDIQIFGPAPDPTPSGFSWVRTGGPLGGLGYDVRMRPDNPDHLYVTDAWAGVFVSKNGGISWIPSNQGITTRTGASGDAIPVFCLTIDPHNHDTIWIGTQNVRGIFKSADGGQTWTRMDNGVAEKEGITFRGISIDPSNPQIVYAAAELSSWVWNDGQPKSGREFDMTAGVVYKTTDGGLNWVPIWRGQNLARYVWIDPRDPQVVYISTGIFDREAANSDPQTGLAGGEGILKSTDGGKTWDHANKGLENLYVGTLFMHPKNPDILLAGTGNVQYHEGGGVYLSQDGGETWEHVLKGDVINSVEFAISNPSIAYAGSSGRIYISQDGGFTWQRVTQHDEGWGPPGVRAGFPIDFQVDPRDSNRIFANEYGGGNFLSHDGGRSWEVASAGYTGAQVRDIAVDPASGSVYAAARSGLFASQDGGSTWKGLNWPPAFAMEWYAVAVDPLDPQHILAANNWNGVILESRDGGYQSWRLVSEHAGEMRSWRAIAFTPSQPDIVYAGTSAFFSAGTFSNEMPAGGIFKSTDGGASWHPVNDRLSKDANVIDLAISPNNPNHVFAATGNHSLLMTSDGGQSWLQLKNGLPDNRVTLSVAINPIEENILFTGIEFGGLYRSEDGGESWSPSAAGLNPESSITDVIFDPTNHQVMYLSDILSGVYRSTDGGFSWLSINQDLRTRAVNKLAITVDSAHLYAATEGEGVFRLDLRGEAPSIIEPSPMPTELTETTATTAIETFVPGIPEETPTKSTTGWGDRIPCIGSLAIPLIMAGMAIFYHRRGKIL